VGCLAACCSLLAARCIITNMAELEFPPNSLHAGTAGDEQPPSRPPQRPAPAPAPTPTTSIPGAASGPPHSSGTHIYPL
jgi:hypothetical protein